MQYLYAIMLIGYARVSTGEQTTAAQVAALKTSGCELIFRDNASGGRWDRPELHKLLSQLRKGDVLVVWTLDRLSRSLRDVLTIMERVQERHAGFRSLKEAVDTTTPAGRMMMQMVGAFAEFERAMLKERTKAGLDAARKEGRIGGRPPKLKPHQHQEIVTLVKQGKKTAADAARLFGVHPATVSRLLRRTWIESSTVLSVPLLPKPQPLGRRHHWHRAAYGFTGPVNLACRFQVAGVAGTILLTTTTIEWLCADTLVDAERRIEVRLAERVSAPRLLSRYAQLLLVILWPRAVSAPVLTVAGSRMYPTRRGASTFCPLSEARAPARAFVFWRVCE